MGIVVMGTVALLTVGLALLVYFRMAKARNYVDLMWDNIEAHLKRRQKLIPGLVAVARDYRPKDTGLYQNLEQAYQAGAAANTLKEVGQAENSISRQLRLLLSLADSHPELKADPRFVELHQSLHQTEDQVRFAARYYDEAVKKYNAMLPAFPYVFLQGHFDFEEEESLHLEYATDTKE